MSVTPKSLYIYYNDEYDGGGDDDDDNERNNKLIYVTNCKTSGTHVLRMQTKASNPPNIFSVRSTPRNERGFTREKKKKK